MGIKDALFCSTALLTVAAVNDARATDGVKLGIGGYYHAAAGAVIGEDFSRSSGVNEGDVRDYVFKQKVDLTFNGETTLDNGLTVGAHIELKGETDSDQIDETWIYFSGGFGELKFGSTNDALVGICLLPPGGSRDQRRRRDRLYLARHRSGIAGWRGRLQRAADRHRNRHHVLAPCAMDDLQWRTRL